MWLERKKLSPALERQYINHVLAIMDGNQAVRVNEETVSND
jgi:hypothetical protein